VIIEKMRCFVAIDVGINEAIAAMINDVRMMGKPVEGENIHLTLKFLGEVEDTKKIEEKLAEIRFGRFSLTLKGLGAFPDKKRARILFLNALPPERVSELASLVHEKTSWIPIDHPFTPHITILRIKGERDISSFISRYDTTVFGSIEVTSFHLYRSVLTHSGPVYTVIRSYQLI